MPFFKSCFLIFLKAGQKNNTRTQSSVSVMDPALGICAFQPVDKCYFPVQLEAKISTYPSYISRLKVLASGAHRVKLTQRYVRVRR